MTLVIISIIIISSSIIIDINISLFTQIQNTIDLFMLLEKNVNRTIATRSSQFGLFSQL